MLTSEETVSVILTSTGTLVVMPEMHFDKDN